MDATIAMDPESAELILRLQMDDMMTVCSKGKRRAGSEPTDQELAMRLFRSELEAGLRIVQDHRMSLSLAQAMDLDGPILREVLRAEETASRDRRLAEHMTQQADDGDITTAARIVQAQEQPQHDTPGEEFLAKMTARYFNEAKGFEMLAAANAWPYAEVYRDPEGSRSLAQAESSARGAKSNHTTARLIDRMCESCRETRRFYDLATLPGCRHNFCRDCLCTLIQYSTTDESLYPPRCCRTRIDLAHPEVRPFLSLAVVRDFEAKSPELECKNRTYCYQAKCATWIPPAHARDSVAHCPKCRSRTCTICKATAHVGVDCPRDEETQVALRTADAGGWQRCPQCRTVVELTDGCNHITCRCRSEFCYICGLTWKTCTCPLWDENRLLGRAARILERQRRPLARIAAPPAPAPAPAPAPLPVPAPAPARVVPVPELPHLLPPLLRPAPEPAPAPAPVPAPARAIPAPVLPPLLRPAPAPALGLELLTAGDNTLANLFENGTLEMIRDHLRNEDECEHSRWRYIPIGNTCESCNKWMPRFVFECRGCALRACARCKRNRL